LRCGGTYGWVTSPCGEGLYTDVSDIDLRVVWISFDANQFSAIVHDSNRTRSLLLALKLFSVRRHVERNNDDLGKALNVTTDQCHHQPPNSNTAFFLRVEKVQLLTPFSNPTFSPFSLPKPHHHHDIYNNVLATSPAVSTFAASRVCNLREGVNKTFSYIYLPIGNSWNLTYTHHYIYLVDADSHSWVQQSWIVVPNILVIGHSRYVGTQRLMSHPEDDFIPL